MPERALPERNSSQLRSALVRGLRQVGRRYHKSHAFLCGKPNWGPLYTTFRAVFLLLRLVARPSEKPRVLPGRSHSRRSSLETQQFIASKGGQHSRAQKLGHHIVKATTSARVRVRTRAEAVTSLSWSPSSSSTDLAELCWPTCRFRCPRCKESVRDAKFLHLGPPPLNVGPPNFTGSAPERSTPRENAILGENARTLHARARF